ncbi:hypothetical protein TOT_020000451 [Theileria orientalis strain Shintoku]|uniref:Uncharacterized protein n=1 Tax=Theileria orientalis strain Shintoku TaxID=869250 RepID=J4DP69_THEOR|nr:hypothetical protein TOT_020000451 [Theileria orientalis strain Shintoku]BAM40189.1 hypothetical protein TOT_020000451 [Theileria orientalis strain Shintoku]|eukprot:XP_009690490.1 hypothetical protein TOT_020000451 [Theileria orientalis strain Shintoku]
MDDPVHCKINSASSNKGNDKKILKPPSNALVSSLISNRTARSGAGTRRPPRSSVRTARLPRSTRWATTSDASTATASPSRPDCAAIPRTTALSTVKYNASHNLSRTNRFRSYSTQTQIL